MGEFHAAVTNVLRESFINKDCVQQILQTKSAVSMKVIPTVDAAQFRTLRNQRIETKLKRLDRSVLS